MLMLMLSVAGSSGRQVPADLLHDASMYERFICFWVVFGHGAV